MHRKTGQLTKQEIRQVMLNHLKSLDAVEKKKRDAALIQKFLTSPSYSNHQVLALFLSMDFELNTQGILTQAQKDGKTILIPKTYPKGKMTFVPYNKDHLCLSRFGIREPNQGKVVDKSEIDLILVPGLAFGVSGHRLGFGAGYYDRYLADFKGKTVSLSYAFQRLDFEVSIYDIAVQEVIDDTI